MAHLQLWHCTQRLLRRFGCWLQPPLLLHSVSRAWGAELACEPSSARGEGAWDSLGPRRDKAPSTGKRFAWAISWQNSPVLVPGGVPGLGIGVVAVEVVTCQGVLLQKRGTGVSKLLFGVGCDSSTRAPGASPGVWQRGSPCLPTSSLPAQPGEGRGGPLCTQKLSGVNLELLETGLH